MRNDWHIDKTVSIGHMISMIVDDVLQKTLEHMQISGVPHTLSLEDQAVKDAHPKP
jgi:hypothetical protein